MVSASAYQQQIGELESVMETANPPWDMPELDWIHLGGGDQGPQLVWTTLHCAAKQ
jgi:hypothetical protein